MFGNSCRFIGVLAVLIVACSDPGMEPDELAGKLDQACRQNSTCDPGLLCVENICVNEEGPVDAGLKPEDAGDSTPDAGTEICARFEENRVIARSPSNIKLFFSLRDCENNSLSRRAVSDFLLQEDGEDFTGTGPYLVDQEKGYRYYHHAVVDLRDASQLTSIISSLKAFATELVADGGQNFLAVSVFDGRSRLVSTSDFSNSAFGLREDIEELLTFSPQGSEASVSGALSEGLDVVEAAVASSSVGVTQGTLLLFATGADVRPSSDAETLEQRISDGSVEVFAVTLGDQVPSMELMKWTTRGVQATEDIGELTPTLRAIAGTVYDWTQANYILSYCSNSRAGSHTVNLSLSEGQGMLESRFSAEGFTDGCDAASIIDPCGTRACGVVDGLVCGQCREGQVCDLSGVCIDAPEAPSRPQVSITPSEPVTLDALSCQIDVVSEDPNGDEVQYAYRWQKEGLDAGISGSSVPSSMTAKHELWQCIVTPSDGVLDGESTTARVTILNSIPTSPTASVAPAMPYTNDDLNCTIQAPSSDDDGDSLTYEYAWLSGASIIPGPVLSSTLTRKNQRWQCSVVANDGEDLSPAAQSVQLQIQNSLPTRPTIEIAPALATHRDNLTCRIIVPSTDADNDTINYTYTWSNGTQTQLGEVLNFQSTSISDNWTCTVTPNDLSEDGPSAQAEVRVWDGCRAVDFDGVDDHIGFGSNAALRLTETVSIEFWVKPDTLTAGSLVRYAGNPDGNSEADNVVYSLSLASSPGHIAFMHESGAGVAQSYVTGSSMVQAGTWHHVALVRDGAIRTYRLFVDGVPLPFILFSSNASGGTSGELSFGGTRTATHAPQFDGHLDEIRIWNRSLSQQEIQTNKALTLDPTQSSGLVGYWPLLSTTGTVAIDHSGQGNNGNMVWGPNWSSTSICDVN